METNYKRNNNACSFTINSRIYCFGGNKQMNKTDIGNQEKLFSTEEKQVKDIEVMEDETI